MRLPDPRIRELGFASRPFGALASILTLMGCAVETVPRDDMCVPQVRDVACGCADGESGVQLADCRGNLMGICECPTRQSCDGPATCVGTAPCTSLAGCDECECIAETSHPGYGEAFSVAPDGDAFVLLTREPWLVRHTDTTASNVPVQSDLDYASSIVALDDSLLVVGAPRSVTQVTIQRFDRAGMLLGTSMWSVPLAEEPIGLRGVHARRLSDGRVLVVASTFTGSVSFGIISDALVVEDVRTVTMDTYGLVLQDVEEGEPGIILMGGYVVSALGDLRGGWFARVSLTGQVLGFRRPQNTTLEASYSARVAESSTGDTFLAWSWKYGTGEPFEFVIVRENARLGDSLWGRRPEDPEHDLIDAEVVANSLAIISTREIRRMDIAGVGELEPMELRNDVLHAEAHGDRLYLLTLDRPGVSEHSIKRITFVPIGAAQEGGACQGGDECESGTCCLSANSQSGTCNANAQCATGLVCSLPSDCASGGCQQLFFLGICAQTCTSSGDCPPSHFCAESACGAASCPSYCLRDCTVDGDAECEDLDFRLECEPVSNAEGVPVSLCR